MKKTLFVSSLIPGMAMAMTAIFGIANLKAFRAPVLNALMNRDIEISNRATVLSGVSMIERVATTLLYPLAGMLTDISLNTALFVIGIITIILSITLRIEDAFITQKDG